MSATKSVIKPTIRFTVKSTIKSIVPQPLRASLWELRNQSIAYRQDLSYRIRGLRYQGDAVFCPCCRGQFSQFLPAGVDNRANSECPRCVSRERHRLIWLYLETQTNFFRDRLKVLHIAPELLFQKKFVQMPNLDYISADLDSPLAMVKMDITQIPDQDNTFDVILCNHVLEHVPDDHKAMQELYRVLKPTGWAILQVPIDLNRETTFEDLSITDLAERERLFGQKDHLRWYGRDYADKLRAAGFTVKVDDYVNTLDGATIQHYGLRPDHKIYFCTK
ncbi:MAG: methyltransferase domain-containing protein [Oscillatoriales cyanobacterium RM2_1_1]|nr:methyltransferase domain-containing protein [Oscillatoriales cyanobacterium SM2_3_0]NJO47577.1 methyltransferase domain-containing protein [Oscillatoriales cyanobacterium RM2_1_1]